jgi:hypothetical protein
MGTPTLSLFQRSERMDAANRSDRLSSQAGMGLPQRPWVTVNKRSASFKGFSPA